jgi:tight adherence protein B
MLTLLKYVSLLLFGIAAALFVGRLYTVIAAWWSRRIHGYASWIVAEFDSMMSDMSIERARRLITLSIAAPFALGYLLSGFFLAFVLAVAGYFAGWAYVSFTRSRRLRKLDDQLVDALVLLGNCLKAGLSLVQGLEIASRELKPPISDEIGRIVKEIHLGRLTDDALRRFAERVPLEDVRLAVDSILTLRETGGNLSETFQVIAQTVVERKKVQGKIQAMTSQGMTQGVLICTFPIAMLLLFAFIDPEIVRPFFTTILGWFLLTLVFVLDGLGLFLMFHLVKVDV